jgi:uncharacterized protein (DUF2252 family)
MVSDGMTRPRPPMRNGRQAKRNLPRKPTFLKTAKRPVRHHQSQPPLLTAGEHRAQGKALRQHVARAAHAGWNPPAGRPDPIELLKQQNRSRVQALVPIRFGRMLESPFAFFRGAALIMASDLSSTPVTGIRVHACGDCHLGNFGAYATPERNFVFDINDFDETNLGPWEWDVKRLAASIVVAARYLNIKGKRAEEALLLALRRYRTVMVTLAKMTVLETWYVHYDVEDIIHGLAISASEIKKMEAGAARARMRTPDVIQGNMTKVVNGAPRFIDNPPQVYHSADDSAHTNIMHRALALYRESLRDDIRLLFDRYQLVDMAHKVVGVGSVGTRCGVMLLMAGDGGALVLQVKEATNSVLDGYAGKETKDRFKNHGERVVTGQRIMQATSDMFLGWTSFGGHDYYIRQLRDMKASVELALLTARSLVDYAAVCGMILARAHARSGQAAAISGYLGKADVFDLAIAEFAEAYADQNERDHAALKASVRRGTIKAAKDA